MSHFDTHPHHHAPTRADAAMRALWAAFALNGGFLLVEAAAGWWTGSLALLGDAAHMLSDVAALAIALGAARLARRPPSASQTFGLRRAETVGAFVNGLILVAAALGIAFEAVRRIADGAPEIPGWPVLIVGVIGLGVNLGSAFALWRSEADDLNVRGALLHMLADALGSVGAIIAAGLLLAGFPLADPVVSVLIAALVLVGATRLLRDAGRVLLQLPPVGFDVPEVVGALAQLPGVFNVHDLHVWTLDGQTSIVTAHLVARPEADLEAVRAAAAELLEHRYGVDHATLQVERDTLPCPDPPCALDRPRRRRGHPADVTHRHPHGHHHHE